MRTLLLLLILAWASTALAEMPPTGSNGGATAIPPAPVPAIPPGTPQTGAPAVLPERIAPHAGAPQGNHLSSSPSSLTPKNNGTESHERPTTTPPELSR